MQRLSLTTYPLLRQLFAVAVSISLLSSTQVQAAHPTEAETDQPSKALIESLYVPLLSNNSSCVTDNGNAFGVQMYTNTSLNARGADALQCSGASWVRVDLDWVTIEPNDSEPADYNWANADNRVAASRDLGKNIILTLEDAPSWAANFNNGPIDVAPMDELVEFMSAVVERYDGDGVDDAAGITVGHFELYNEPDAQTRWGNAGDQYAEMLKAVYPAIKAANPDAQVLFGGIAYDFFTDWVDPWPAGPFVRSFLTDVLDNDGGDYFDVMAFHQYPAFAGAWADDGGAGLIQKTEAIRSVLADYNLDKPIMITESGTYSGGTNRPDRPEEQSRHVAALNIQSLAADVDVLIWFWLRDDLRFYSDLNGLVADDGTHKQSMQAYQTLVTTLGQATFDRTLSDGETGSSNTEAYQFTHNQMGTTIYAAWTNSLAENNASSFTVAGSRGTIIDLYGVRTSINDGDDGNGDGRITLNVNGQPRYLIVHE